MKPAIDDFTTYWDFDKPGTFKRYAGILFGENILVYINKVFNLSQLFGDNSRILNAHRESRKIYVLLENENLYVLKIAVPVTYKFVCANITNMFLYKRNIHMLQNDGKIMNSDLKVINENISVVSNIPRYDVNYFGLFTCDKNNNICGFVDHTPKILPNTSSHVISICIVGTTVLILHNNNTLDIHGIFGEKFNNIVLPNINSISAVSGEDFGIIYDNDNVIINNNNNFRDPNYEFASYKGISIPNSSYCADFNAQTIPYYPKYFMDRFIAFVMSVKYSSNIKLPKYLYFMIANHLK